MTTKPINDKTSIDMNRSNTGLPNVKYDNVENKITNEMKNVEIFPRVKWFIISIFYTNIQTINYKLNLNPVNFSITALLSVLAVAVAPCPL